MYTKFIIPEHLASKGHKNWNKKQAKEYFDWFINEKSKRVQIFIDYFNIQNFNASIKAFIDLKESLYKTLIKSEFSENKLVFNEFFKKEINNIELTDTGFAIGADLGLFILFIFEKSTGLKFEWTINTNKRASNVNMPVCIGGFNTMDDFIERV